MRELMIVGFIGILLYLNHSKKEKPKYKPNKKRKLEDMELPVIEPFDVTVFKDQYTMTDFHRAEQYFDSDEYDLLT